jgi:hypothetical protein
VGVLHGLADRDEQLESLSRRKVVGVAILGDRNTLDEFHHEVRATGRRRASVEHLRDIWMIHDRQRLSLCFEPGDNLAAVHARFENLESDLPAHRLRLLGHEHDAEAALADLLQQLVWPD